MQGSSATFEKLSRSISSLEQRVKLLQLNLEVQTLESHFNRKFDTAQEVKLETEEIKENEKSAAHSPSQLKTAFASNLDPAEDPLLNAFTEDDDDREIVHELFNRLTNGDKCSISAELSAEDLLASARKNASESEYIIISTILTAIQSEGSGGEAEQLASISVSFDKFWKAFQQLPRVHGERVRWVRTLGIDAALARLLRKGDALDGLRGLRELMLNEAEAEAHVQEVSIRLFQVIPELLRRGLRQLGETAAARSLKNMEALSANTKFADNSLTMGRFASLDDFYKGPEALFGTPNPRVDEGIRKEHLGRLNAEIYFTSHNYGVETCPKIEWEIVVSPQDGQQYPSNTGDTSNRRHQRDVVAVDELLMRSKVKEAVERTGLLRTEVICLRLYTGPMYVMYNAALRGVPEEDVNRLLGNKYETTIFVITSGITKLSKFTDLPKNRLLYRGLSGRLVLPYRFWNRQGESRLQLRVRLTDEAAAHSAAGLFMKEKVLTYRVTEDASTPRGSGTHTVATQSSRAMYDPPGVVAQVDLVEVDGVDVRLWVTLGRCAAWGNAPGRGLHTTNISQLIEAVRGRCASAGSAHLTEVTVVEISETTDGLRGGVEYGMLSLTKSLDVALQYGKEACGRRGVVFEVQVGRVDIGASIGFLSQYPEEEEFLMPPLSCLEVTGEPRLDCTSDGREVVMVPLRVNMNLKAMSVEDLIGRRKMLHAAASKNLRDELRHIAEECVERLGRLIAQRRRGIAEVLHGSAKNVDLESVTADNKITANFANFVGRCWTTLWAPYLTLSNGRVCIEIEVLEATGTLAVGFAGTRYSSTESKVDIGDDAASWGIYSFGKLRHKKQSDALPQVFNDWFKKGKVLCVEVDLDEGCIRAAVSSSYGDESKSLVEDCGDWVEISPSGAKPSQIVGGGLFPVIAGGWGACVKYSFRHEQIPPTKDFVPATEADHAACAAVSTALDNYSRSLMIAQSQLKELGVDSTALLQSFDDVRERHEALPAEDYNHDDVYKEALDQILFAKVCALKKQAAVVELLEAGAKPSFLDVMRTSPPGDFDRASPSDLAKQCPKYTWGLILSGWLHFVQEVTVPFDSAPCLIALVWRLVLDAAAHRKIHGLGLQTIRLGNQQLNLSALLPTLQLEKAGLQSNAYENAVLGFFLAAATVRDDVLNTASNNVDTSLTAADLQGQQFSEKGALRLAQAIVHCRLESSLRSVNGLVLEIPKEGQTLQSSIKRNGEWLGLYEQGKPKVDLGTHLDAADWGFVAAEAAYNKWQSLNARSNGLGRAGAARLAVGLGTVTTLTVLDISDNDLHAEGATAFAGALTSLAALIWLEAGRNSIGVAGAAALAAGARHIARLQGLGLAKNEIGDAGASFVCDHIAALTTLVRLDLKDNNFAEAGGEALATALLRMPKLAMMSLRGQDVGRAVWSILKVLSHRIEVLSIESGVIRAKVVANSSDVILSQPFVVSCNSADNLQDQYIITIDLSGKKALGPKGAHNLAKVLQEGGAGERLTALELSSNRILSEGANNLVPALIKLSALTRLGLSSNGIGHDGSKSLESVLPRLSRLRSLNLEGNAIGVARWLDLAKAIGQLPALSSLNGFEGFGALVAGSFEEKLDLAGKELAPAIAALLPSNRNALKSLDISQNCLDASASENPYDDPVCTIVDVLGSLSALTCLRLGGNALGEAGCVSLGRALLQLCLLTELDASRVELGKGLGVADVAIAKALRGLTKLEILSIANNAVKAAGAERICSALDFSTSLCSIDLGLNQLGPEGAAILAKHVTTLLSLKTLKAPENAFGSDGGRALGAGLSRLTSLTFLDLRCNDLGPAGGEAILDGLVAAASVGGCILSTLDLRNNNVGADGCPEDTERLAWLDGLARLSGLMTLSLAANSLAEAGGRRVVAAVAQHSCLSELDLGDNNLGENCGQAISEGLGRLPALHTLFLEGNSLETKGAGAVVSALGRLATVQSLDLRDNALGPFGGTAVGGALSRLTALRALDLEGNKLGPSGGVAVALGVTGLELLGAMDLRHNSLGPKGCSSVQGILSHLSNLRLGLGWNNFAHKGWERTRDSFITPKPSITMLRKRDSHRAMYVPKMSGNLQKLGQKGDPDGDSDWRDRLCFVEDGCLYYKSEKKKGENELVTQLSLIRSVLPPTVDSRPDRFMFTVEMEGGTGRTMTFAAATAHERKRWITALLRQRTDEPMTPLPETPTVTEGRSANSKFLQ